VDIKQTILVILFFILGGCATLNPQLSTETERNCNVARNSCKLGCKLFFQADPNTAAMGYCLENCSLVCKGKSVK
jgi:hypothetical protein